MKKSNINETVSYIDYKYIGSYMAETRKKVTKEDINGFFKEYVDALEEAFGKKCIIIRKYARVRGNFAIQAPRFSCEYVFPNGVGVRDHVKNGYYAVTINGYTVRDLLNSGISYLIDSRSNAADYIDGIKDNFIDPLTASYKFFCDGCKLVTFDDYLSVRIYGTVGETNRCIKTFLKCVKNSCAFNSISVENIESSDVYNQARAALVFDLLPNGEVSGNEDNVRADAAHRFYMHLQNYLADVREHGRIGKEPMTFLLFEDEDDYDSEENTESSDKDAKEMSSAVKKAINNVLLSDNGKSSDACKCENKCADARKCENSEPKKDDPAKKTKDQDSNYSCHVTIVDADGKRTEYNISGKDAEDAIDKYCKDIFAKYREEPADAIGGAIDRLGYVTDSTKANDPQKTLKKINSRVDGNPSFPKNLFDIFNDDFFGDVFGGFF